MTEETVPEVSAPAGVYADLAAKHPEAEFGESFTQTVCRVPRDSLVAFTESAVDAGFRMFVDLCAVDYLQRDPRFDVVINLLSMDPPQRLRILVGVPGDEPTVPSITPVLAGANFYEREAFDLFGIRFIGHPDLTRILLPDEWVGHPLRKDAAVGSVPVQFKGAHTAT
jgi:NADH-quinone oxidoreductase subunit C